MSKSIHSAALILLLLLVSLSCQLITPRSPLVPTPAETPVLTPVLIDSPTPIPSATLPPAPEPTQPLALPEPTNTLSPAELANLLLFFWPVQVSYDPAVWQPGSDPNIPMLEHRSLPGCLIVEQGPTEPPGNTREERLGEVTYAVAELSQVDWYMATSGPNGPFPGGLPTLLISADPTSMEPCRAAARTVLATMRETGGP